MIYVKSADFILRKEILHHSCCFLLVNVCRATLEHQVYLAPIYLLSSCELPLLNAVITPAGISCAISNEIERSKAVIPTSTRFFINTSFKVEV